MSKQWYIVHTYSGHENKAMQALLGDSIEAGAIGFSTSRAPAHLTPDDQPVASRIATWDEVRAVGERASPPAVLYHELGLVHGRGHGKRHVAKIGLVSDTQKLGRFRSASSNR